MSKYPAINDKKGRTQHRFNMHPSFYNVEKPCVMLITVTYSPYRTPEFNHKGEVLDVGYHAFYDDPVAGFVYFGPHSTRSRALHEAADNIEGSFAKNLQEEPA